MRKTVILLLSLFCLALHAQKTFTLEQVKTQWQNKTIKVETAKPNILQLMQAFNHTFPTYTGRELIKFANTKAAAPYGDKVVDLKNGYVEYGEDDPDSENDEKLQACVWNRSNGHRLLAISLHRFTQEIDVLCFYDFNPQTRTLTPEKSLGSLFTPSFPGQRFRVWLPRKGKTLRVSEYLGMLIIDHVYAWNGMKPSREQTSIKQIENFRADFAEHVFFAEEHPLTQYAMADIDSDGFPELLLRSDDEQYVGVFAVKLAQELLGAQDDRRTLSFFKGAVCSAGQCGAGCLSSIYTFLEDSGYEKQLVEQSEYDNQLEDFGSNTYTLNGDAISSDEGQRMLKALGGGIELNPVWRTLAD